MLLIQMTRTIIYFTDCVLIGQSLMLNARQK